MGWLTTSAKEVARAATAFSYDLASSTYQTFTEGWSSIGQGVSEVSKFGLGTLGFAASLAQAGLAAAGELADSKGLAIADSRVDMLGWALAKAGIKTVGVPKSELRELGMSLARLHMGKQQDIHITEGKLELSSNSDGAGGIVWARSHKNNGTPSSPVQSVGSKNAGSIPLIRVGNIHLEGIKSGVVKPLGADRQGNAIESLTISADRLAFDVEYWPSGSSDTPLPDPITMSIEIEQPELVGESNLLSLVATSIIRYCSGLKHHLPGFIVSERDDSPAMTAFWNQENTGAQLKSQVAHINIRNLESLAPEMTKYIPEVAGLSLIDLDAGLHKSLIGDQASKPSIFFESLEFDGNDLGPIPYPDGPDGVG